jgi:uncharacterized protein (DUF2249 family)/quercetin dioxygenase-like cupin family protein
MSQQRLDVRDLPKSAKHPRIFAVFDSLPPVRSFVLINNHERRHLRAELDADHHGEFGWRYLEQGPGRWQIEITRLAATPTPQIMCDTREVTAAAQVTEAAGAVWKPPMSQRDLDANIIHLPAGSKIDSHAGPDLDVLVHVLQGNGELITETEMLTLQPGSLLWLPRRSRREIAAGPQGLTYLTVHPRRPGMTIQAAPPPPQRATHRQHRAGPGDDAAAGPT